MPATFHVTQTLREGGRRAYAAMVARTEGQRYTIEHGVEYRLANPTVGERAMIDRLAELGQREKVDYEREYILWYTRPEGGRAFKIPDMAWPERRLLIEVQGSIRASRYGDEVRARDARKAAIYRREGWRVLAVAEDELLRDPAGVRERMRAFLAGPDGPGRPAEEETGGRDT
ncbi:MAG: endonuclease domain-containing protein [Chloroflexota bacterium]|nr:endonuclease domain-containing protein [Chloroflexota bacterium]